MPVEKLKNYLNDKQIKYAVIAHSPAFTAQEVAQSAHISGNQVAKTVVLKVNGKLCMLVLPASDYVDLQSLKKLVGNDDIELATESDFKDKFPGCEVGAIPPFGNLYDMDVYMSDSLSKHNQLAFSAGNYSELIQLDSKDYQSLVNPQVLSLG